MFEARLIRRRGENTETRVAKQSEKVSESRASNEHLYFTSSTAFHTPTAKIQIQRNGVMAMEGRFV